MKQIALINPESATAEEVNSYEVREAARAIVIDMDNRIALLTVGNERYCKIPGGGIEEAEDKIIALQRECMEEIGCKIEVTNEIGIITEYRKIFKLKQISYCYLAKVKGKKGRPTFTDEEVSEGFKVVWMSFDDALAMFKKSRATSIEGKDYILPRDSKFLQEAKKLLVK